jgi:hypothetical protein
MLTVLDRMIHPLIPKKNGWRMRPKSQRHPFLYPCYAPAPTALTRVSGLRLCSIRPKYVL